MSCGNPHATPCDEVDAHLDEYLDRELSAADIALLEQHFKECPPCQSKYRLALLLKLRLAKACGCAAPSELRQRVMKRITEMRGGNTRGTIEETQITFE